MVAADADGQFLFIKGIRHGCDVTAVLQQLPGNGRASAGAGRVKIDGNDQVVISVAVTV